MCRIFRSSSAYWLSVTLVLVVLHGLAPAWVERPIGFGQPPYARQADQSENNHV